MACDDGHVRLGDAERYGTPYDGRSGASSRGRESAAGQGEGRVERHRRPPLQTHRHHGPTAAPPAGASAIVTSRGRSALSRQTLTRTVLPGLVRPTLR